MKKRFSEAQIIEFLGEAVTVRQVRPQGLHYKVLASPSS